MKHKKKIALGAAVLAAGLMVAGTFAWFTTTDQVSNVFEMDSFDVIITEDFDPSEVPLNPGANVTKNVTITNHGNVDVLVRVKLEEALSLLERETKDGVDKLKVEYTTDKKADDDAQYVPVLISEKMIGSYTAAEYEDYTNNAPAGITVLRKESKTGDNTVYSYLAYVTAPTTQGGSYHQLVRVTPQGDNAANPTGFTTEYAYNLRKDNNSSGQYSVTAVHNQTCDALKDYYKGDFHTAVVLHFSDKVSLNGEVKEGTTWVLMNDGYFYYTKALAGESISDPLLESVEIAGGAENTLMGATYTITPQMEAVQMDYDAAAATWKMSGTDPIDLAVVSDNQPKQLVYNIVKNNGVGYYTA